ncbi:sugar ABC transporter periplasmic protein [Paenibacillus macerans]|uniref:Extracellular solute-binding, family 1 domain protein n=1 Tax=Paenibacillus macerans TaxID=44252 RepID=A0A090YAK1_PAEMA|nr:extracellular solute-binding, family 1 domain protein [Paenibacillus macerans]SUA84004.1 sugar ABC transporter periplasmic protein [Paenibacillus macerans]
MKNHIKGTSASLLAMLLLLSQLVGCAGNNSADGGDADQGKNSGGSGSGPIKLTYFSEDPSANWNDMHDRIGKVITEKTGVVLDAEFAVGDPVQKVSIMAATGEVPDLIAAKADLGKLVDVSAVLDLTDLIEKHAPNIKKCWATRSFAPNTVWKTKRFTRFRHGLRSTSGNSKPNTDSNCSIAS